MRIGVIGAGAIGGTIACLLDRAGHQVEVTARGEHLAEIRASGLRLTGAWGEHTAHVEAGGTLRHAPEIAFVCTKAQDAAAALNAHRDLLVGILVVIVQNGLNGLDQATALLPEADCVGALALYAASFVGPGRVSVTTPATTYLGAGSGEPPLSAVFAAQVLAEAMPAVATANFTGCQWTKLIVNQINAMPAITGMSAQDCLAHPGLRRIVTAGLREAVRIGYANEVRYGRLQGLSNGILRLVSVSPLWLAQLVLLAMKRRMGPTPNPGSTLQSIRRGQPTEIDYLNGAIVEHAGHVGRNAPVNAAIVSLVHRVERTHTFLTPDAVVAELSPRL